MSNLVSGEIKSLEVARGEEKTVVWEVCVLTVLVRRAVTFSGCNEYGGNDQKVFYSFPPLRSILFLLYL